MGSGRNRRAAAHQLASKIFHTKARRHEVDPSSRLRVNLLSFSVDVSRERDCRFRGNDENFRAQAIHSNAISFSFGAIVGLT
jgi:hypothetical protein